MAVAAAARLAPVNPMSTQVWNLVCASLQLPASRAGSAPRTAPRMRVADAESAVIIQVWPTVHDQPGCSQPGPRRRFAGVLAAGTGTGVRPLGGGVLISPPVFGEDAGAPDIYPYRCTRGGVSGGPAGPGTPSIDRPPCVT